MRELVHPHNYRGVLTLTIAFIMASSATLIQKATVSHLVLYFPVELKIGACFWSTQGASYDAFLFIYLGT